MHKHQCPQCGKSLTCNNPKDCPGVFAMALCGSCPFIPWAGLIQPKPKLDGNS